MDIADAATYFDNDPVSDGYSGAYLYDAQTASFNDSSSDGATNRRRVLSLAPDLAIPARRVLLMYGDRWVVGTGTPDGFLGTVIRQHFTMKRVTDSLAILTPGEALAVAAGTAAYAQKSYFRDTVNNLTDSEIDTFWNIFLSPDEPVAQGTFFRDAVGRLYRVRNDYLPLEGLRVAQTDALDTDSFTTATFDTGTFDVITEGTTTGSATVNAVKLDVPKFYRFRHISDPKTEPGDLAVFVPAGTPAVAGKTFTMDGIGWRIMSIQAELDALAILARRT